MHLLKFREKEREKCKIEIVWLFLANRSDQINEFSFYI